MREMVSCLLVLALAAGGASADVLINTDFDIDSRGWTPPGGSQPVLADTGTANGMALSDRAAPAELWSYNATPLPQELQIDLDFRITDPLSPSPLVVGFHVWGSQEDPLSPVSGPLRDHNGYFVVFTSGQAPPQQRIQIQRRGGPNPEDLTVIASEQWVVDSDVHHLRITDCGCGRLTVFVDNMDSSFLYTDNKYQYVGRQGTLLGVGMPGTGASWIDNVMVEGLPVAPEPAAVTLLLTGGMVGLIRRRL